MQISFFDGNQRFKIDKPIRLIELFAGIGSQAKALKNLGVSFEHYRICEFDKYAVASYNAVHGTNFETSDITKITANDLGIVDTDKYCYIMTYSFPCQDLSNAGLGKGMAKDSGTRSGLLWEVERLLDECSELPQVLLMENVPAVVGEKNVCHFAKWIEKLESLGYKNKWQILNAKDFGIPQNRERCFMVSILGDYYYEFPKTIPLNLRLKDMLEKEVDEKYYLSDRALNGLQNKTFNCGTLEARTEKNGVMSTLCARDYKDPKLVIEEPKCIQAGMLSGGKWDKMHDQSRRYYSIDGTAQTIPTSCGGNHEPKIAEPLVWDGYNQQIRADSSIVGTLTRNCGSDLKRNGQGIIEPKLVGGIGEKKSNGGTQYYQQDRVYDSREIAMCHPANLPTGSYNYQLPNYRIRKLTPKECWRLQGFDDADIDKAIAIGMSNAQLYKQAGNSIVVNVLMAIFKQMI